jgi:tetratricopeptide (TPR) repeat protein
MMRTPSGATFILGCVLLGVCIVLSLEEERTAHSRAEELAYLPKGPYLRLASLGYRQIVADIIWLQAVQHLGAPKDTSKGYRWTYHAVDVLTDLDPTFVPAYQAAGTILGVWAGRIHESIAILRKGMRHNPQVWQFPFLIGYDFFYELCDPSSAARYLQMAAVLPGAPDYLPRLASRMAVEAGDPDAALEFLERFLRQTKEERLRETLAERIRHVAQERNLRFLEDAVQKHRTLHGRLPARLEDLVMKGIIEAVPPDPFGGRYFLDPKGAVQNTAQRERLRLHQHVGCQGKSRQDGGPTAGNVPPSFAVG